MTGSPPSSASRAATSTSSGGSSSRLVSPNRSRNSKPVPYRNGRPGRVRAAELDDQPAMEQGPDRVVRIDAADPLDRRLRDRLAVGDDRQRLERRRRQADRVGADVAGDQRAALGRGRELDPVAVDQQADAAARGATTSRSPSRASTVARSVPASAAISRRDSGRSATNRSASRAASVSSIGAGASRRGSVAAGRSVGSASRGSTRRCRAASGSVGRSCERLQRLVDRRVGRRSASTPAAARSSAVVDAGDDRAPRLGLLDDDLAPLHELEHRQERDRDDDPVADAAEQVLEHDASARRAGPPG